MKTLALRAEDKNEWERRTPLVPEHVRKLVSQQGARIIVEPSSLRIFPDEAFSSAGAMLRDDLVEAEVIIGVKEIPLAKILPEKTYLFFSHTIKGQSANMPLLKRIIESRSTLLDYERIVDPAGRRLLFFGNFAGDAGAVDILWLIGQDLRRRGFDSSLAEVRQAMAYKSLSEAKSRLAEIGQKIAKEGLPKMVSPFVIGIFGYGNVSKGAQEIFDLFPNRRIEPEKLAEFMKSGTFDNRTLYQVIFQEHHMVRHTEGSPFSLQDYYQFPEQYEPVTERYLPFFKLLVNAVYWTNRYPHFVSKKMVRHLWEKNPTPPFLAIADLSCDLEGAIELTVKSTDPGTPAFKYHPLTGVVSDDLAAEGIVVLAVDNLPCEFALDASEFFSTGLSGFIPALLSADFSQPLESCGLPPELQRAVVVQQGRLTPNYTYLHSFLAK
jgi:saccharopine dehydrogenase (NAD+, L-lysine forming)